MTATDEFLANAEDTPPPSRHGHLPMPPAKPWRRGVHGCPPEHHGLLGLSEGEAHVIRNAGGVVSDDVVRSLAISQRLLGTREIVLIHHTDCGMLTFSDDE